MAFRDGRLVEFSTDGQENVWAEVLVWEPPSKLVMSWHPGRGVEEATTVEVRFESAAGHSGEATTVTIEHRGWETLSDGSDRRRSYIGPSAWGFVLDHFSDGTEPHQSADRLDGLRAAYQKFFAEAEAGGFAPPEQAGEWDADQVIAHVALNDAAMINVCHAIISGRADLFANDTCQQPEVLARLVDRFGGGHGLIEHGRQQARQLVAVLGRLTDEQLATDVHCLLAHDGSVVLDEKRPWGPLAIDVQSGAHLPAHIEQLRNLRPVTPDSDA